MGEEERWQILKKREDLLKMHELSVMQSILDIVLEHARENKAEKVLNIGLQIGELTDLIDEWMQKYFDYLSKDTIAAGARLTIDRSPAIFKCEDCGNAFHVKLQEVDRITCSQCGGERVTLISGRDFYVDHIEVV